MSCELSVVGCGLSVVGGELRVMSLMGYECGQFVSRGLF